MARLVSTLLGAAALALLIPPAASFAQSGTTTGSDEEMRRGAGSGPIVGGRRVQPTRPDYDRGAGDQRAARRPQAGTAEKPTGDPELDAIYRDLSRLDRTPPPRSSFELPPR